MSFELVHALRAALDDGCSLAELEAKLLNGCDTEDRLAAAWLYAWAYDELRPPRDGLAARITSGAGAAQAPKRRVGLDARPFGHPGHDHRSALSREGPPHAGGATCSTY